MPDIKLRDGSGVENTYQGVDTITLPLADGSGTWTFGPLINFHPASLGRVFAKESLIYKEEFFKDNYIIKLLDLTHADNNLSYMFEDNDYITDLRNIVIGNTAVSSGSVVQTFSNCKNLIHLPDINIPISKGSSLNSIGSVISGCYSLPQDEIQNLLDTIYTYQHSSSPQGTILSSNYQLKQIDLSKNTSMYGGKNTSWTQGVGSQPTLKSIILPKMSITGATTSNMNLWSSLSNAFS